MKNAFKGPLIYILLIVAIIAISTSLGNYQDNSGKDVGYTEFIQMVKDGSITSISVTDRNVYALKKNSQISSTDFPTKYDVSTYLPTYAQFDEDLKSIWNVTDASQYKIPVTYVATPEPSIFVQVLPYLIPIILVGVLWFVMMRQSQGGGKAMNFGKSRAKMTMGEKTGKTFADVAGADEEKDELAEIVEFLRNPKQFTKFGARIPKGVLLVGPPGGGKTLLAKAVAGEAKVPFFSISGSDFVEMFVGVGASRVRDLFDNAKKNAPAMIFIDEIDAVGRQRGTGLGGGHDEREQTLNQLLVEMDGFMTNEGIIVIAATNRADILDPALLRAGRFDRQIVVNYPDVKGREEILKVHAKGKPLAPEVDLKVLAKRTPGFIGADLENVLNEAAILTARRKKEEIGMSEIEEAITRVVAGPEKKSRVVTEKDKHLTAIHEVGHAIVAHELPGCDSVHEISIIPRGMAAGYTMTLPDEDDQHMFKSRMEDQIAMMLGGRAAEKIVIKDISAGASNDIQRATDVARSMVVKYGMSDLIGPVCHNSEENVFLGKELGLGQQKMYSEEVAGQIDDEIKRIIEENYVRAQEVLTKNIEKLNSIAAVLVEREKLDGEEFEKLMRGETLPEKVEEPKETLNAPKAPEKPAEPEKPETAAAPADAEKQPEQPGPQDEIKEPNDRVDF